MTGSLATAGVLIVLFGLIILGGGVLVWMAPVPAEDMTPAREILLNIADWMIKASVGAILGFAGSRLAVRRSSAATA
ncbi:MAG: hypothetical protein OXI54_09155 [Chloroflexota bacterium]|nr:hypothetical protein [Chloroflexota bacterium]MDE2684304.1 hypothetical protein [Chloroflexota bacterium]